MDKHVRIINGMATFACPKCSKRKTVDVSRYQNKLKMINVGCKCPCGHSFSVFLDRRADARKDVVIQGTYTLLYHGKEIHKGKMAVMDVSRTGLKIKLFRERKIEVGDRLIVKFNLNDKAQTLIQEEAEVRRVSDLQIGAEFCSPIAIKEEIYL